MAMYPGGLLRDPKFHTTQVAVSATIGRQPYATGPQPDCRPRVAPQNEIRRRPSGNRRLRTEPRWTASGSSPSGLGPILSLKEMIRAVRRRVTVYRIYRQNRALWDSYVYIQSSSASSTSSEALLALDTFLLDFLSSYDRLSQPKLLHRIFGESFLPAVVDTLIRLIAEFGSIFVNVANGSDPNSAPTREVIERALTVCSIILQDPVHSSQVAFNLPLASQILSLLEAIDGKDLKTLVLQLISGLCYNHESRLEIARLDGFRKILGLLNHGDESLSHQILKTLRVFLDAESDNQYIFEERRSPVQNLPDSMKCFADSALQDAAKLALPLEKAGTWSRSRTIIDPDKRPVLARSKSLVNLDATGSFGFPAEFGSSPSQSQLVDGDGVGDLPLSDREATLAVRPDRDAIMKHRQLFSDLNNSTHTTSTSIVKSMLTTQGALEQLSRSLQESPIDMQLELLRTISKLMLRNDASQREFAKIKGYGSITHVLLQAARDCSEMESREFLSECFVVIFKIVVDGDPGYLISNISAFSWLISEIAPSSLCVHSPVLVPAVNCLNNLLIANPRNAAAYIEHVPNIVSVYACSPLLARPAMTQFFYHLGMLLSPCNNAVLDGVIHLWTPCFDQDLLDCTSKLVQQQDLYRTPRSTEIVYLMTSIGTLLCGVDLYDSQRFSLIQLLVMAACSGEAYPFSSDSDPELLPSCVDLEEAMDILFALVINFGPESDLALYFLGFLASVWSSWSALNSTRLGHHADSQLNNSGLRLLFQLLQVENAELVGVLNAIALVLVGFFGDCDLSRVQRELSFTSGLKVLIDALLLFQHDPRVVEYGVFVLLAAVIDSPSNKIDLECEPRLSDLLDVLIVRDKTASFEACVFDFLVELATESEESSKGGSLLLPDSMASMLSKILVLVKGRPSNKLILTQIDALAFILRSWPRFFIRDPDVQGAFFPLISCLGRYSIQPNQVKLLFDLAYDAMACNDPVTECHVLHVIAAMASRVTPESYFNFKPPTAPAAGSVLSSTFTRTPVSRTGYSVMFWFKISEFACDEASLFTWMQSDAPLYEVLLRLTPRPTGDTDRSVCIRCTNLGTFMFDKAEAVSRNVWHHLVLTHSRGGVVVMIDSVIIGRYPAVPYPSTIIKRDVFQLAIGGSNIVGRFGNVHVLEGCVDRHQAQGQFALGPSAPVLFGEMRSLLKVHAGDLLEPVCRAQVASPAGLASRALSASSFQSENQCSLPCNVDVHQTISFQTALNSAGVGGIFMCIPFIGGNHPGARLTSLRILADLILKSAESMAEFERHNGCEMLAYCLTPAHLSMDVFSVLLEMTRKLPPCMPLIMDLLGPSTGPGTRTKVIGIIADLARDDMFPHFHTAGGLANLLELLSVSSEHEQVRAPANPSTPTSTMLSSILSILEQVISTCASATECDILFAFIVCKQQRSDLLCEERAAIIALFCRCAEKRESLLSSLSFLLVVPILESTCTSLRVQCLRLLALLFRNSPKNKSAFVKMHGFDAVLRLLARHQPVHETICDAIFDLALDLDRYNHIAPLKTRTGSSYRLEESPNAIVHPEAIRLLLELLRLGSSRPTLHLRYVERLEELIESRPNLNIILSEPWLHWSRQYLEGIGRFHCFERPQAASPAYPPDASGVTDTESVSTSSVLSSTRGDNIERHRARLVSRFVRLIQKILIRDLSWHSGRASCLPTLLSMVEASEFVPMVVDRAITHLEKHPRLDESESYYLIRNLARVIESIDELCGTGDKPVSGRWSVRLIHLINLLASQNNGDVRARMKQSGLFDLRDQLLLRFCQHPCSSSDRFVALLQLSMDAVASDAKFRNSDGILYLLRWFICDGDHQQLRMLLVDVLRHRLGLHQESRKDLERAVADADIIQHLSESNMSDEEFVAWFFDNERDGQRQAILTRLEKSLQIAELTARKQYERIDEKRQKRIRSRLDTLGKAAAASERAVQEFLERSEAVVGRFSKLLSAQMASIAEARRSRLELGAVAYANHCQSTGGVLERSSDGLLSLGRACPICAKTFDCDWDLICHIRLDHWSGDAPPPASSSVMDSSCATPSQN